jgi:hypothetical protein
MWEDSVLGVQLLAVQAYGAVGWMIKESSISFWHGGVSFHLQSQYIFDLFLTVHHQSRKCYIAKPTRCNK